MRRRQFIKVLAGSAAAWPLAARAQQGERTRRVGILMPYSPSDKEYQDRVQAFKDELRNRGWTAGVNVQFDERWTMDSMDLIRAAARNLLELKPDVVVAVGGRVIPILMEMTSSIPIIVPGGTGPVERGWAKTLARPGGNVTGFSIFELSIIGKMLQTLKEIAPNISHVAMIYNPDNPGAASYDRLFERGACHSTDRRSCPWSCRHRTSYQDRGRATQWRRFFSCRPHGWWTFRENRTPCSPVSCALDLF